MCLPALLGAIRQSVVALWHADFVQILALRKPCSRFSEIKFYFSTIVTSKVPTSHLRRQSNLATSKSIPQRQHAVPAMFDK